MITLEKIKRKSLTGRGERQEQCLVGNNHDDRDLLFLRNSGVIWECPFLLLTFLLLTFLLLTFFWLTVFLGNGKEKISVQHEVPWMEQIRTTHNFMAGGRLHGLQEVEPCRSNCQGRTTLGTRAEDAVVEMLFRKARGDKLTSIPALQVSYFQSIRKPSPLKANVANLKKILVSLFIKRLSSNVIR